MTPMQIIGIYVALNALIALALAMNTARVRNKTKILLGDGGNEALQRAMRAHSNNIEYVPITLIMLVMLGILQASVLILHIVGASLTLGRVIHGLGLTRASGMSAGRGIGIVLTYVALLVAVVALFMKALA
jgi:uncharacterized protein